MSWSFNKVINFSFSPLLKAFHWQWFPACVVKQNDSPHRQSKGSSRVGLAETALSCVWRCLLSMSWPSDNEKSVVKRMDYIYTVHAFKRHSGIERMCRLFYTKRKNLFDASEHSGTPGERKKFQMSLTHVSRETFKTPKWVVICNIVDGKPESMGHLVFVFYDYSSKWIWMQMIRKH